MFGVVIKVMCASDLLVEDVKKTPKNYPLNVSEFSMVEFANKYC